MQHYEAMNRATGDYVVIKAWHDHAADVIDLKFSKMGGISKAKEAIDFCAQMGLAVMIDDTWGSKYFYFIEWVVFNKMLESGDCPLCYLHTKPLFSYLADLIVLEYMRALLTLPRSRCV